MSHILLAMIYGLQEDPEKARQMETPEMRRFVESAPWAPYYLAQLYAVKGRDEEALDTMEGMLGWGAPHWTLESSPAYAHLRGQPQFRRLVGELSALPAAAVGFGVERVRERRGLGMGQSVAEA